MDPVTAIFNFLSTPVGQKLIDPLVTLENNAVSDFSKILQDLVVQVHAKIVADAPKAGLPPVTVVK